ERSTTGTRPGTGVAAASRPAIRGIGPAEHIVVAPQPVGGEKGNVRCIAHAVGGIAQYGLPRGLGPTFAASAHNSANRRRATGPGARASAACNRGLQKCTNRGVIAQAR